MSEPVTTVEQSPEPMQVVRAGTWFLVAPAGVENANFVAQLLDGLRNDTRVLEVIAPELNAYWTRRIDFFPDRARTTGEGILTGSDVLTCLELSNYLTFKVRVPIKNQPKHHGVDDVPSDTYWVAWNGVCVFVWWEQAEQLLPLSGGHIVERVLRDVVRSIEGDLYVQNCGPGCKFNFLHTSIRLEFAGTDHAEPTLAAGGDDRRSVVLKLPEYYADLPANELVVDVAMFFTIGVEHFAAFKNSGRRLIDIEAEIRQDLAHLLGHYYEHAATVGAGYRPTTLKFRWKARGRRKEAWQLISRIWLAMANLEAVRRKWADDRNGVLDNEDVAPLLTRDYSSDLAVIEALELEPVADSVNQVATALNNRQTASATLWGALAGGVAGGAAGIIGGG